MEMHSISGHKAFLGFFYLDYAYNNAVMHVFIENLKDSLDDNPNTPSSSGSPGTEGETVRISTHRFPPASKSHYPIITINLSIVNLRIFHGLEVTLHVTVVLSDSLLYITIYFQVTLSTINL